MIKENIDALVDHLERLISAKTIIGEPITAGNIQIIPVMSASFGFGTGVGESAPLRPRSRRRRKAQRHANTGILATPRRRR